MSHACIGKQNAKKTFNKKQQRWNVYWEDEDTGKHKTSTYARWYWETNHGEIPEGYRASFKDKNPLNIDPENIILISPEELGKTISERLMGHGFSDETLQKMSDAKKGKSLSEDHKKHIGEQTKKMWKDGVFDAPHIREAYSKQGKSTKGSRRTEEQKRKMSESKKGKVVRNEKAFTPEAIEKRRQKLMGRKQTLAANQKRSLKLQGRVFTDQHLFRMSEAGKKRKDIHGANSHWWKGGVANQPYPDEFSDYLKRKIRRRDKYICQACGINTYGSKAGHVHHVDGDKQNCIEDNLLLLCATCHNAVHGRNNITSDKIEQLKSMLK